MHPKRKQRLLIALAIVALSSATIGLIAYALSGNINLFYSPSEVASGEAPLERKLRVGGMVVEGSIKRASDRLETIQLSSSQDGGVTGVFTHSQFASSYESSVEQSSSSQDGISIATEAQLQVS